MRHASGSRVRTPALHPALRNALGGVLAVALVSGGIVALQWLVPADRDSPAVVSEPDDTFTLPATPSPQPPRTLTPKATPSPTPKPTTASPTAAVRPAVTVLNNSRVTGLAAKAARDFQNGGWSIVATGNLSGRLPRTTVYFSPGQEADALTLRRQFPAIQDVAPRYAGLPGEGGLTVVVTRDYPH